MLATINPAQINCEHTLNTLRYADRVRDLKRAGTEDYPVESPLKLQRTKAVSSDNLTRHSKQSSPEVTPSVKNILDTTPPPKMNHRQVLLARIERTIKELQAETNKCQDEDALETMGEELKGLLQAIQSL